MVKYMNKKEIIEDEKHAKLYNCVRCGNNNYIVKLNKDVDIIHLSCITCGMKYAVFKVGEK